MQSSTTGASAPNAAEAYSAQAALQAKFAEYDRKYSKNPGNFDKFHDRTRDIFPMSFEGILMSLNFNVSQFFRHSHTLSLTQVSPPGYKFGVTLVGKKRFSESDAFPFIMGDIDPSGNLNSQIIHQPFEWWRTKFVAQVQQSKMAMSQWQHEFRFPHATLGFSIGNVDIAADRVSLSFEYLQNVTSRFTAGTQLLYFRAPEMPAQQATIYSLAGRYNFGEKERNQVSAQLSPFRSIFQLCFMRRIADGFQVGTEFSLDHAGGNVLGSVGYQADLPRANLSFKTRVDSNLSVEAVFEKKLAPLPFTLALSAQANHRKSVFRCGIGLMVG